MDITSAENSVNEAMTPAMKMYENHKRHVLMHQKRHPEKVKEKMQRYVNKMRREEPEKYELMKQKQRDYYHRVVKPRKDEERKKNDLKKV